MERPGFWKSLLSFGTAGVVAATLTFGALEEKVEKIELTTNQVKVEYIEKKISIDEYRSKTSQQVIFVEQRLQEFLDGAKLSKSQRKQAWRNLVNGYKSSERNLSRFENDLQILNDFVTSSNWYEFANSQSEIKRRYTLILSALQNSIHELKTVRDVILPENLKQNQDHSGLSDIQSSDLKRKIEINRESLQQSYKLLEWYAEVLILKTEIWNLRNPGDSIATQQQYNNFLSTIKTLKFDPNKF